MNIFYLDHNPTVCAQLHCDKHVVKMILEYAQLLSTAHRVLNPETAQPALYKATHINHPSAVWVRQTSDNYHWLFDTWDELLTQYTSRYDGRIHRTQFLWAHLLCPPKSILVETMTPVPQCMPDDCKVEGDAVAAYRKYYATHKSSFAQWKNGQTPNWMKIHEQH